VSECVELYCSKSSVRCYVAVVVVEYTAKVFVAMSHRFEFRFWRLKKHSSQFFLLFAFLQLLFLLLLVDFKHDHHDGLGRERFTEHLVG
jgi:hypothetical protein